MHYKNTQNKCKIFTNKTKHTWCQNNHEVTTLINCESGHYNKNIANRQYRYTTPVTCITFIMYSSSNLHNKNYDDNNDNDYFMEEIFLGYNICHCIDHYSNQQN